MADPQSPAPLSFETRLVDRPIRVDGVDYHIKHPDSFSLRDTQLNELERVRIWQLFNMERDADKEQLLERTLRGYCKRVTTVPAEALEKFSPSQLFELAWAFITLRSLPRETAEAIQAAQAAMEAQVRAELLTPPGSPSSPDSAGSTAEAPGTGTPSALLH